MQVDAVTAEVSMALDAAGIEHRLMKGPTFGCWLYDAETVRGYGDSDLLVPPSSWDAAGDVLRSLGFVVDMGALEHPRMEGLSSFSWVRPPVDNVDLHATLAGIGVEPAVAWAVLSARPEPCEVNGRFVPAFPEDAKAFHVAIHATHHHVGKQLLDLERAITVVDMATWQRAAAIAEALDALPAFATGMRLSPAGVALADSLGIGEVRSVDTELKVGGTPLAEGLEGLLKLDGLVPKLRLVAREVGPTPAFMRWWSPLARRGRRGLAVSYVGRLLWLVVRTPPAVLARQRAHRNGGRAASSRDDAGGDASAVGGS